MRIAFAALLLSCSALGAVLIEDPFKYQDGALVQNAGGKWLTHSGTSNQLQVTGEKLILDSSATEDVSMIIPGGPYAVNSGAVLYAGFKLNVLKLPSPGGAYFAHFKDGGNGFRGRLWALTSGAVKGKFKLGLSSLNSSDPTETTDDLVTNTVYNVVLRLSVTNGLSALWINPMAETDTSLISDFGAGSSVSAFAFRQNGGMGLLQVDDFLVGAQFQDVAPVTPPGEHPPLYLRIAQRDGRVALTWNTLESFSYTLLASDGVSANFLALTNGVIGLNRDFEFLEDVVPDTGGLRLYKLQIE